jgi:outer membrane biosynthesis protein TonB
MWVKKPPIKRYEATSAPSPKAPEKVDKLPDTPLTKPSAEPPPPDAAIAKKVDPNIPKTDAGPSKATLQSEGSEDGVKEGTETDPLKAFAVSQYRMKISGWFNARFKRPSDQIPCDVLKKLRASVSANVSGSRTVSGYSVTKASGNEIFDTRVKATLDAIVSSAAELPPPPPNYPDVLGTTISVAFFVPSCD